VKIISSKRCIIGEGPIWNTSEKLMYFTNGFGNEICTLNVDTGELSVRPLAVGVAAIAFDRNHRMIVSREDGVFYLNDDDTVQRLYEASAAEIRYGNDMKVGPDGRIYVGTRSGKHAKVSEEVDGKLYCIDSSGNVQVLLDGLILSNGMEWSMDEKRFYHTDSATQIIREYNFDKEKGDISFTGREVKVPGIDGFTMDRRNRIVAACWGRGCVTIVDTNEMIISRYIDIPTSAPASCGFVGENLDVLAVVTASYNVNLDKDPNAGYVYLLDYPDGGRKSYLFGRPGVTL